MKKVRKKQTRFAVAVVVAVVTGLIGGAWLGWKYAPLIGWDLGALSLLAMFWHDFTGHSAEHTAAIAKRDDMSRSVSDVILIIASLASIVAVAFLLTGGSSHNWSSKVMDIGFGLASIVISWAIVHSIYTLRYAVMYYQDEGHEIDFNDAAAPRFSDFAYVAFTIGMTYQVSDTNFKGSGFRSVAIRHALLSFVFGTVIIATTINFIASLAR